MVTGHPFKERIPFIGIGYLMHPDMKRFNLTDNSVFAPPRPDAWVNPANHGHHAGAVQVPTFGDYFATYFSGRSFNCANDNCSKALEGLKRCWESHATKNPQEAC